MSQRHGLDDEREPDGRDGGRPRPGRRRVAGTRYLASWHAEPTGPSADEQFDLRLKLLLRPRSATDS